MDPLRRRYFVLTRKGLHYYVRQNEKSDGSPRRDLFGEHEGSVALGNISHIDLVNEEHQRDRCFVVVCKGSGRRFVLRAGDLFAVLFWVTVLGFGAALLFVLNRAWLRRHPEHSDWARSIV